VKISPWLMVVALSALMGSLGCAKKGSDLPTVTVTGKVTLDGAPLEGATVSFASKVPDAKPANGVTDAQGNYRLQTFLGGTSQTDGALPGEYIVMVQKFDSGSQQKPTNEEAAQQANASQQALTDAVRTGQPGPSGMPGSPKLVTPAKYQTKESTTLTAIVESGKDNVKNFELDSK
jgi:hypothetical protein